MRSHWKFYLAISVPSLILLGVFLWARYLRLPGAERSMRERIPRIADVNRGMLVRARAADTEMLWRSQPTWETELNPQEVRALARDIELQKKPRDEFALEEGRIDYIGITLWLAPKRRVPTVGNADEIAIRLEWGFAIEGDRIIESWEQFELTPKSVRALKRTLWQQRGEQLKVYVSAPD